MLFRSFGHTLRVATLVGALLGCLALGALAQTGIGTTTPSAQAILDLRATDRGLLVPRLTTGQRTALGTTLTPLNNPLNEGMIVYDTDLDQHFAWNETTNAWQSLAGSALPALANGTVPRYNGGTLVVGSLFDNGNGASSTFGGASPAFSANNTSNAASLSAQKTSGTGVALEVINNVGGDAIFVQSGEVNLNPFNSAGAKVVYTPTNSGTVTAVTPGANGQVLKLVGGVPTWDTDATGSFTPPAANVVPRSDGANLVAGSITDDGAQVEVNSATTGTLLRVISTDLATGNAAYFRGQSSATTLEAENSGGGLALDLVGGGFAMQDFAGAGPKLVLADNTGTFFNLPGGAAGNVLYYDGIGWNLSAAPGLNQILKWNGTAWAPAPDATGGTPTGTNNAVAFYDGTGALNAGFANFNYNSVNQALVVSNATTSATLQANKAIGGSGAALEVENLSGIAADPAIRVNTNTANAIFVNAGDISLSGTTSDLAFRVGVNVTGFRAPGALPGNQVYTLPADAPAAGEVLSTDAAGNLSWVPDATGSFTPPAANVVPRSDGANLVAGSITDDGTDVTITSATSGTLLTLNNTGTGAGAFFGNSSTSAALQADNSGGGFAIDIVSGGLNVQDFAGINPSLVFATAGGTLFAQAGASAGNVAYFDGTDWQLSAAPGLNEILKWDGTDWAPAPDATGGTPTGTNNTVAFYNGTGALDPGTANFTFDGTTVNVNGGASATAAVFGNISASVNTVQISNTSGTGPALNVSSGTVTIDNLSASVASGGAVVTTDDAGLLIPLEGTVLDQVLKWNGTAWVAGVDATGGTPTGTANRVAFYDGGGALNAGSANLTFNGNTLSASSGTAAPAVFASANTATDAAITVGAGRLQFEDGEGEFVAFAAPADYPGGFAQVYTLPANLPANGDVLTTTAAGVLSWAPPALPTGSINSVPFFDGSGNFSTSGQLAYDGAVFSVSNPGLGGALDVSSDDGSVATAVLTNNLGALALDIPNGSIQVAGLAASNAGSGFALLGADGTGLVVQVEGNTADQVLKWNSTNGAWELGTDDTGGLPALNDNSVPFYLGGTLVESTGFSYDNATNTLALIGDNANPALTGTNTSATVAAFQNNSATSPALVVQSNVAGTAIQVTDGAIRATYLDAGTGANNRLLLSDVDGDIIPLAGSAADQVLKWNVGTGAWELGTDNVGAGGLPLGQPANSAVFYDATGNAAVGRANLTNNGSNITLTGAGAGTLALLIGQTGVGSEAVQISNDAGQRALNVTGGDVDFAATTQFTLGAFTGSTSQVLYTDAGGQVTGLPAGVNGTVLTLAGGVPTWAPNSVSLPVGTANQTLRYDAGNALVADGNLLNDGLHAAVGTAIDVNAALTVGTTLSTGRIAGSFVADFTGNPTNIAVAGLASGATENFGGNFSAVSAAGETATAIAAVVSGTGTNYAATFTGGNVGVGTVTPTALLDLNQSSTTTAALRLRTQATAPSAPNTGDIYADDNTVFYRTLAGTWLDLGASSAGANLALSNLGATSINTNLVFAADPGNKRYLRPATSGAGNGTELVILGGTGAVSQTSGNVLIAGGGDDEGGDNIDQTIGGNLFLRGGNSGEFAGSLSLYGGGGASAGGRLTGDVVLQGGNNFNDNRQGGLVFIRGGRGASQPAGDVYISGGELGFGVGRNGNVLLAYDYNPYNFTQAQIGAVGVGLSGLIAAEIPSALLDINSSTATRASLRLRNGVAPTSPNPGDIYADGSSVFYRTNASTWLDLGIAAGGANLALSNLGATSINADLIFDNSAPRRISLAPSATGQSLVIQGGESTTATPAGLTELRGASNTSTGQGGPTNVVGGQGGTNSNGGQVTLTGGLGNGTGGGGAIALIGGTTTGVGVAGSVFIYGGTNSVSQDGNVVLAYNAGATRGRVGVGELTPTALLDIGTPPATTSPLRLRPLATAPTFPNPGDIYTDNSTVYYRTLAGTWLDLGASSAGANLALSNLGATAINADLLPDANGTRSLGTTAGNDWLDLYLTGAVYLDGAFFAGNEGTNNTFLGSGTGFATSGTNNVFVGTNAGSGAGATGGDNVFVGTNAGDANTSGAANTFLGSNAGAVNNSGQNNVMIGASSGLSSTTGLDNVFIGNNAGQAAGTGSSFNTYVGRSAGVTVAGGDGNTFVGNNAGTNVNGNTQNSIYIGNGSGRSAAGASTRATALGFNAIVDGDDAMALGSNASATATNSVAIGPGTTASQANTIILGDGAPAYDVGIGTATPAAKLDIAPTTASAVRIRNFGASPGNTGVLEFGDLDNSNFIGIRSADAVATSYTITLPAVAPATNAVLTYDGTNYQWALPATQNFIPAAAAQTNNASTTLFIANQNDITVFGPEGDPSATGDRMFVTGDVRFTSSYNAPGAQTRTIGFGGVFQPAATPLPSATAGLDPGDNLQILGDNGRNNGTGGPVTIRAGAGDGTGTGGVVTLAGGTPGASANGGGIVLQGANGSGLNRSGGAISLTAGNANGSGTPGAITLVAGNDNGSGSDGGLVDITAGAAGTGNVGGRVQIVAGDGAAGGGGTTGGSLYLAGGLGGAPAPAGNVYLTVNAAGVQRGQVGVGTLAPDASALLDVASTNQGFLPPRLTTAQRDAINGGVFAPGLVVYNSSDNALQVWNGAAWVDAGGASAGWALGGNTLTAIDNLGSNTAFDVNFVRDGNPLARMTTDGIDSDHFQIGVPTIPAGYNVPANVGLVLTTDVGFTPNIGFSRELVVGPSPDPGDSGTRLLIAAGDGNGGIPAVVGGDLDLRSGSGGTAGNINIDAAASAQSPGGQINLTAGGSALDVGGDVTINGGTAEAGGGNVVLSAGDASAGPAGAVFIAGGTGGSAPGDIVLQPGTDGSGDFGKVGVAAGTLDSAATLIVRGTQVRTTFNPGTDPIDNIPAALLAENTTSGNAINFGLQAVAKGGTFASVAAYNLATNDQGFVLGSITRATPTGSAEATGADISVRNFSASGSLRGMDLSVRNFTGGTSTTVQGASISALDLNNTAEDVVGLSVQSEGGDPGAPAFISGTRVSATYSGVGAPVVGSRLIGMDVNVSPGLFPNSDVFSVYANSGKGYFQDGVQLGAVSFAPTLAEAGLLRYNSGGGTFEGWDGSNWLTLSSGASLLGYTQSAAPLNTGLGFNVGNPASGVNNIYVGPNAGFFNASGEDNILIGNSAGEGIADGRQNVAIGTSAGRGTDSGFANVYIGHEAGSSAPDQSRNTFVGANAGTLASTASSGVFVGCGAGLSATGTENTLIGIFAGSAVGNTGSNNVFLGSNAGLANTSGSTNVMVGRGAGGTSTTGSDNVYLGFQAGISTGAGSNANTFVGRGAGSGASDGSFENTFLGYNAGVSVNGATQTSVFIGSQSGRSAAGASANATALGYNAIVDGDDAMALGTNARATATNSVAVGPDVAATQINTIILGDGTPAYDVGIGLAAPAAKLHVDGGAAETRLQLTNNATGNGSANGFYISQEANVSGNIVMTNQQTGGGLRLASGQGNGPTVGGELFLEGGVGNGQSPGNISIFGGSRTGSAGNGGPVAVRGGRGFGTGNGGVVTVNGGDPGATGQYGNVEIAALGGAVQLANAASATSRVFANVHNKAVPGATGSPAEIASGTYNPLPASIANVNTPIARNAQWIRVGNVVTVSGSVTITVINPGTNSTFEIPLPIPSDMASDDHLTGSATYQEGGTPQRAGLVTANFAGDVARIDFIPGNAGPRSVYFSFTYRVQ